jgi:hypothetical protein
MQQRMLKASRTASRSRDSKSFARSRARSGSYVSDNRQIPQPSWMQQPLVHPSVCRVVVSASLTTSLMVVLGA